MNLRASKDKRRALNTAIMNVKRNIKFHEDSSNRLTKVLVRLVKQKSPDIERKKLDA